MSTSGLRTENLARLTWPIFLQNATNSAVMFVDFVFFSYLSDTIAGTVGQLLPVFWMGAFVIPVFAGTGISVASQYMGAKRLDKVIPVYMMNLGFTAGMGGLYSLALAVFASDIGKWLGMADDINRIGTDYLSVICYYFVFMGVMVAYNAILSSRGMTHWLMYTSFAIAGVNLVLNSVFVFVFGWGVRGIALASVLGAATAMSMGIFLVHYRLRVTFYFRGVAKDMVSVLRPMLRIGIPNAVEPLSYSIQQTILSAFIISMGIVSMAANNYAGRLQVLHITFGFSLAQGAQILMAHWVGQRRFEDVNRLYWRVIGLATCVSFVSCIGIWYYADLFLSVFTGDPAIRELAKSLLLVSVFLEPARAVNIIGGFSLRTVGDARFPLIISVLFIWGILPVIYFADAHWQFSLLALWGCFAADEVARAFINMWRWQTGKWRTMGIVS